MNIVYVLTDKRIHVIWVNCMDENQQNKRESYEIDDIVDIQLIKTRLFVMKKNSIQQADYLEYFANARSKKILQSMDEEFKSMHFIKDSMKNILVLGKTDSKLYIYKSNKSYQVKVAKNENLSNKQIRIFDN